MSFKSKFKKAYMELKATRQFQLLHLGSNYFQSLTQEEIQICQRNIKNLNTASPLIRIIEILNHLQIIIHQEYLSNDHFNQNSSAQKMNICISHSLGAEQNAIKNEQKSIKSKMESKKNMIINRIIIERQKQQIIWTKQASEQFIAQYLENDSLSYLCSYFQGKIGQSFMVDEHFLMRKLHKVIMEGIKSLECKSKRYYPKTSRKLIQLTNQEMHTLMDSCDAADQLVKKTILSNMVISEGINMNSLSNDIKVINERMYHHRKQMREHQNLSKMQP